MLFVNVAQSIKIGLNFVLCCVLYASACFFFINGRMSLCGISKCWYNESHLSLIINFSGDNRWKNVNLRHNTIKIIMVIMKIRLSFLIKNLKNILKLWKHFIKETHNTP